MNNKAKQYKDIKKTEVTTSDIIKKSFSNVYKKLEGNDVVFASNQRKEDLVIMTLDNYESLSNSLYDKDTAFDGVVVNSKQNVFLTRKFVKENTYLLMQFESMNVTFPDVEYIASNLTGTYEYEEQVTKNLMDSWKFILGNYNKVDFNTYKILNKIIAQGQGMDPGLLRSGGSTISGTDYKPPVPKESDIKVLIKSLTSAKDVYKAIAEFIPKAIKSQFFWDGNKRSAFVFANLFMINKAKGVVVVNKKDFKKFNKLLNDYYNDETKLNVLSEFILKHCFYNTTEKEFVIKQ